MSSPIVSNDASTTVVTKAPKLPAKFSKLLTFAYWFATKDLSPDSTFDDNFKLFASVQEQIDFFQSFENAEKDVRKSMRKAITAHNKPVKAKTSKPRTSKKTIVNSNGDDLVAELVRMASDTNPTNPTNPSNPSTDVPVSNTNTNTKPKSKPKPKTKPTTDLPSNDTTPVPAPTDKPTKAAEKAALKAAKDAEKVALKAAKDAEKAALKAAKDAEKALKNVEKTAAKVTKKTKTKDTPAPAPTTPAPPSTPILHSEDDSDTAAELDVEEFSFDGKDFLIDASNFLYDPNTSDKVAIYNPTTNSIKYL